MRTHPESPAYYSPLARLVAPVQPQTPTVLFAVAASDRQQYVGEQFTRLFAHTMDDVLRFMTTHAPRLVVVDVDVDSMDAGRICAAAHAMPNTRVLAATSDVTKAPGLIKAGIEAILLKPLMPSLLAARIGRTMRESFTVRGQRLPGPIRVWPGTRCPRCSADGAHSFDFFSHRRMWYACVGCDHVWLGRRQE